jgi:VanZ family protein
MSNTTATGAHSTRLHAVLYGLLLVATPFILLQNYLVEQISALSMTSFELAGRSIPLLPIVAGLAATGLLAGLRRRLTAVRLAAFLVVAAMWALGQQVTDYFFDHNFYDLQQNWHYLAYGLFALLVYRDFAHRRKPMARVMLIVYATALGLSAFDEFFQMHMSSRVFDISDIAKDLWGVLAGIMLIYLWVTDPDDLRRQWRRLRHDRPVRYFEHPPSLLVIMFVFALSLLCYGSLLTDFDHVIVAAGLALTTTAVFFALFHLSRYEVVMSSLIVLAVGLVAVQSYFFLKYRSAYITHHEHGLTIYKGIPIPYFDLMVFPDGDFRPVDKKHYFNRRDQEFFRKQGADIIVVGAGSQGRGGNGFATREPVQFIWDQHRQSGIQVIILDSKEACAEFNRLKQEGKSVLLVLHNTC